MNLDMTALQVLANYCAAAAESMGWTLMRTAYSTFVKETEDFSCQVLTRDGLTVASPKTFGATWYTGLDYGDLIRLFDYEEGDICITSDPYAGYVATHTPDIHMWKPVFRDGRIVCFVGCHIHNTDVGGAVPATLSRTNTEIHQEGLRIPPMRLMRHGVLNADLLALIANNVRLPEQNHGDLNAQIACVNVGERKIHEIIDRFGADDFVTGLDDLLEYADNQARAVIRTIPDGEYAFADYADEDQTGGYPVRIAATLKVHGDTLTVDFTGSDPQLASALNMPTGGKERHALATVGTVYALYCLDPTMMLNAGLMRPTRVILPEGTVMNAVMPAAVGMRSLLCNLAQTVVIGAFCRAVPERLPASPGSAVSIMNVKTTTKGGRTVMASIGPVGGGAGGGPFADGSEGCGANMSFLKNTPVEINEAEVPITIRRYGLVPDTGGPGLYRGGTALEMEFQLHAPQSMVTARNRDRSVFSAWGLAGGRAGTVSRFARNPGSETCTELGSQDVVVCEPGDVILIQGPGAGGYGDPLERPPEAVLSDVRRGLVSRARAETDYGVVIGPDLTLDAAATAALRERGRSEAPCPEFGFGEGRLAFERVWTRDRYAALTAILAEVPVSWRFFVKHQIFADLKQRGEAAQGGAADVYRAYEAVAARFSDLPRVQALPQVVQSAA
ncbi:hydantoinase B/oxoprolinase family protein [Methylobacterium nodulans]|uniref:Hydantoinase B/oxoprolinase n=1 Tax=Methylobacterium nodulans (strain LMG 21967 / CNCM I-2342 / ORS 2060) TaxID=460265 RepID=B8IW01_METNO|nr:hydantoinase B/oxoprolinase family protein [Methylobacterium nodulans]ACL62591.1 Hydantoinase B/oxoprolinase [Methylobacterium nodulans ORS 2060]